MSSKKQQPKWWQVYVALPLLLGLFWPETHARLTRTDHILAELGILGLIFGFMRLWQQANRSAFMSSETTEFGWGIRDSRIASQPPKVAEEPDRSLHSGVREAGLCRQRLQAYLDRSALRAE